MRQTSEIWETKERPGYQGKRKEQDIQRWNNKYGRNNWRIAWELKDGTVLDYSGIFYQVYVLGYVAFFTDHQDDARWLTGNFSYAYDKDEITREQAFDPFYLYDKPGRPNQFHNVALNIALENELKMPFLGTKRIQVREGKPGTPDNEQPEGFRYSPGRIPATRPDLIPRSDVTDTWWRKGTIEDVYQSAKVLQVRSR